MKLALGTVQFGLSYGAFNQIGMPAQDQITRILTAAKAFRFDLLDTAQAYGESEFRLGCSGFTKLMKVVTKIPPLAEINDSALDSCLKKSLTDLQVSQVYGLLFHRLDDVKKIGIDRVEQWIRKAKSEGTIVKWGVSVYEAEEIDFILDLFEVDLIQIPLNIFDQRLLNSGHLGRLKSKGIEVHARSVFLQGLLLNLSNTKSAFFEPMLEHFNKYKHFLSEQDLTSIEACLAFVNSIPEIDYSVIGVDSVEQLESIAQAFDRIKNVELGAKHLAWNGDSKYLNPGKWIL